MSIQYSLALPEQIFREESGARTAAGFSRLQSTTAELAEISTLKKKKKRLSLGFWLMKTHHIQEFRILGGTANLQSPLSDAVFALSKGLFSFWGVWYDGIRIGHLWLESPLGRWLEVWCGLGRLNTRKGRCSPKTSRRLPVPKLSCHCYSNWKINSTQKAALFLDSQQCSLLSIYTWKTLSKIFTFKYF